MTSGRRSASTRTATNRSSISDTTSGCDVRRLVHRRALVRPRRDERQQNRLACRLWRAQTRSADHSSHVMLTLQIIMTGCSRCGMCTCSRSLSGSAASSRLAAIVVAGLGRPCSAGSFSRSYVAGGLVLTTLVRDGAARAAPVWILRPVRRRRRHVRAHPLRRPPASKPSPSISSRRLRPADLALLFWEARDGTRAA